ncbi:hypothetical protein [Brachybacterium sp. ACRRE]|uniref:hypothetical protein n=1 Tax=Brachybacterium sp. ACRRE TaxID=2918184 RepID=UPI001EF3502A|nr:hypothetical protein [Brachybacterium sp. ACRRE]MCG7309052.1 hypothetical protein [Brachybacterium sp. ACRRE]
MTFPPSAIGPSSAPARAPRRLDRAARPLALALALALFVSVLLPVLAPASARADGVAAPAAPAVPAAPAAQGPSEQPVELVLATAGLNWEDISEATPHLLCLAERSGTAAMSVGSMTPLTPTRRQGMETLTSGYLGLASQSHRTSRSPQPAEDLVSALPNAPEVVSLDSLPARGADEDPVAPDSERGRALAALDEEVGKQLDAVGGCDSASMGRVLLVSVAPYDPEDSEAVEEGRSPAPGPDRLQVVMDSGFASGSLTSGSTHQDGVVLLTDVVPTILASHGESTPEGLPGQVFEGTPARADGSGADGSGAGATDAVVRDTAGIRLATDRSAANVLVDGATWWALGSWLVLPALGLLVLLVPRLAARRRLSAAARAAAVCLPLGPAAGLLAGAVPWWRAEHPALALTAVVWGFALVLSAIALLGPWRRVRYGPAGAAGALLALAVLAESATGSQLQLGSPLGAQAIRGGRFYGISNHLSGMVLAGTMIALLAVCARLARPRTRVLAVIAIGIVVMGVSAAPTMGADFGGVLVLVPALGLLALMLSGIRVRWWHLLAVGGAAVVAVGGISVLDWLRPPAQRTHLGRFVDQVLSGELFDVVASKAQQNIDQVTTFWPLLGVLLLAAVLWLCSLVPTRAHMVRLAAFDARHPAARPVRIALGVGAWIGYATNDTGAMLLLAALVVSLPLIAAMLPDPVVGARGDTGESDGEAPPGTAAYHR